MITVFKYTIYPNNNKVELPIGAEVLSVGFQEWNLCMWVKIDTEQETEIRFFTVVGTGHEMPDISGNYHTFIGTAHTTDGLVFHVFELY